MKGKPVSTQVLKVESGIIAALIIIVILSGTAASYYFANASKFQAPFIPPPTPTPFTIPLPTSIPTSGPTVYVTPQPPARTKVPVSVDVRLYEDANCNGQREASELYVTKPTTVSLWRLPDNYIAAQSSNPDSNGFYVISTTIFSDESATFRVETNPVPPGYKSSLGATDPEVTLDKNNTFRSVEIAVLPYSSYSECANKLKK